MAANRIEIIIDGNNVTAVKAIDGVETKLGSLGKTANSSNGIFDKMFGSLESRIALGAGAAVAGLGLMIKNAIDTAEQMNKLSQKVGMSTESLSTLKYAAELSEIPMEQLTKSLEKLNRNLYTSSEKTKEAKDAFKELGIATKDTGGNVRSTDSVLAQLADKFRYMPDDARKTALAMQIFGKTGADMIPLLNQGAAGLNAMREEARALGLEIGGDTAKAAEEFNDNLKKLKANMDGAVNQTLPSFIGFMADVTQGFVWMNQAAKNSSNLTEFFMNLKLIAIQQKMRIEAKKTADEINAEVKNAEKLARDNISGLSNTAVRKMIEERKTAISRLENEPADQKERDNSTLAIQKAILGIYESRFIKTKEQIDAEKKLKKETDNIDFQISLFGLSEIDVKIATITEKYAKLKEEYGDNPKFLKRLISETDITLAAEYEKQMKKLWDDADKRNDLTITLQLMISPNDLSKTDEALIKLQEDAIKWGKVLGDDSPLVDQVVLSESERLIREYYTKKNEMRIKDEDEENKAKADIAKFEEETYQMRMQATANAFGNMADTMMSSFQAAGGASEAWFNFYKAMKISETIISTISSAEKSYDWASAWGGPIAGAIAAAVATAAGLARVGQITSVGPGSVGGGGSVASAALPSASTIQNSSTTNNNNARNITINIHSIGGFGSDADKIVREQLAPAIKKALRDGVINFGNH